MSEEFVKESKILEKNEKQKDIEILSSIEDTKRNLEQANKNFEFADGELIDYYVYKIKANQSKLDYLIKLAKTRGLIMNPSLQREVEEESIEAS